MGSVNVMEEVGRFRQRLIYAPLSAGQVALWHVLRFTSPGDGWFTIASQSLQQLTGLSGKGLDKARAALAAAALIEYAKGAGSKGGSYRMLCLGDSRGQDTMEGVVPPNVPSKELPKEPPKVQTEVPAKGLAKVPPKVQPEGNVFSMAVNRFRNEIDRGKGDQYED